ncbi:hypothetical protein [Daejeonella lutea]|uniref:DUF2314 domain-containing protein n=1 Tax=Daejeonella lutea TaxID=572036 RepID=A0A1T5EP37_9SPHI|nr:hypothetical protein [Daejeonella lutea]SKB85569.1 hypothetical protein SAMN05661099_3087 [Daejeonella lutea]
MKHMKKTIYLLILPMLVVSGFVFANRDDKKATKPKAPTAAEKEASIAARKKWENTPDGIHYKLWEASPAGKKVHASHDKIRKNIKDFSPMNAVVTSTTFKRDGKSASIKWLIVEIAGEKYMMQFIPKDFEKLQTLKVNDRIVVKSRSAGYSPNHPYLILSGDVIEQPNKVLFKRDFSKNRGC